MQGYTQAVLYMTYYRGTNGGRCVTILPKLILVTQEGLWFHIHVLRIRIQLFFSKRTQLLFFNADPDPALKKCVTNYLVKSFPELKRQKNG